MPKKPEKPYPEFPLYAHATGRWCKKIRKKLHYFGPWRDPQAALEKYQEQRDDLHAGREPRSKEPEGLTVKGLSMLFLEAKEALLPSGDLSVRSWRNYLDTCKLVTDALGEARAVKDLTPTDFAGLRATLAKGRGPVTLGNHIRHARILFGFAFSERLIEKPVHFGSQFKPPSRRLLRQARHAAGERMFEAVELRRIIKAASHPLKAMILLGVNCGFGQTDISTVPQAAFDLRKGWVSFPRPKTGINRRCPLWPETVKAIKEYLRTKPAAATETDAGLLFVRSNGTRWLKISPRGRVKDEVGDDFAALLKVLKLKRAKVSFYALRHTFETIAGESADQVAVDAIMGHSRNDMASVYRERISDARLRAVANVVRKWLGL